MTGFTYRLAEINGGTETYDVQVSGNTTIGQVTRHKRTNRNTTRIVWTANSGTTEHPSRKAAVHAVLYPEGS